MEKTIENLVRAETNKTVSQTANNETVANYFKNNPTLNSVVVLKKQKPVGLIMRDHFYFRLGSRYGYAIFINKPVTSIMKENPLLIDAKAPITKASQLAMDREKSDVYDTIIITKENKFLGTVSVKELVEKLTEFKVEQAKNLNPLTNLPGNRFIKKEIKKRIGEENNFSFLYIDLDNFKVYNDCYGYHKGDQVINFTAQIIKEAVSEIGNDDDFVGHIGGDDFVIITQHSKDEALSKRVIRKFKYGIKKYFNELDQQRGYMIVEDKNGRKYQTPLTTLSIAIVSDKHRKIESPIEVSDIAAEVKKEAKKSAVSNFLKVKNNV